MSDEDSNANVPVSKSWNEVDNNYNDDEGAKQQRLAEVRERAEEQQQRNRAAAEERERAERMQDAKDRAAEVSRNREEQKRKDAQEEIEKRQQEARDLRAQKRDEQQKAQREKEENDRTSKEAHDRFNKQRAERKAKEQEDAEVDARKEKRAERVKRGDDYESNRGSGKSDRTQAKAERVKNIEEREKATETKKKYFKDSPLSELFIDKIAGKKEPWKEKLSPQKKVKEPPTDFWGTVAYRGKEHVKKHVEDSWNDVWKVPMGHKDAEGNPLKKSQELAWMQPGTPRNQKIAKPPKGSFLDMGSLGARSPLAFGGFFTPKPAPRKKAKGRKKATSSGGGRSMLDDMLFF
jgi:hypothetical protein